MTGVEGTNNTESATNAIKLLEDKNDFYCEV